MTSPVQATETLQFPIVSALTLEATLSHRAHSMVQCIASWNSKYDAEMRALVLRASTQFPTLDVFQLDTDDQSNFELLRASGIQTLPCLLLLKKATLVDTVQGLCTSDKLVTKLSALTEGGSIDLSQAQLPA